MRRFSCLNPQKIHIGAHSMFQKDCRFDCYLSYGKQKYDAFIQIGEGCVFENQVTLLSAGKLSIGNSTMIASNVLITNENHQIDIGMGISFIKQPLSIKDVSIGNNCWIGQNSVILPGVTIGDNCVIGAGSIVTKSIPDGCIAVGNPAKVIKQWNGSTYVKI